MDTERKAGRPKKYKTAFELEIAVDLYFMACDEKCFMRGKNIETTPYTVEGLCLALDIDRFTLLGYEKDEEDPERRRVVRRAKLRIQQDAMERGLSGRSNPITTIFNLKNNFGYVDKTETGVSVNVDRIAQSSLNGLSLEQLDAIDAIINPKP